MRPLMLAALIATPAVAQQEPARVIQVTGFGMVQTPPDVATLDIWMRGEGATPDAATAALAAKQKAVLNGVGALLGDGSRLWTGNVTVIEVRDRTCDDARGYNSQPRLSQGACAVIGYVATVQGSIRTAAVDRAGTAVGLASRLGASDARLTGFALSDTKGAMARATAAAIADARQRAEAAAAGAGVRLGDLVTIRDQNGFGQEIVVAANRVAAPPAPPAPPPPPPVTLDVKPRPVETRTQVFVSYAIAP